MKVKLVFALALSPFALHAQIAPSGRGPMVLVPNHVVAAGPHDRVWQSVTVDELGVTNINSYTELATGLNFWNPAAARFEEARELIQITSAGYAIATNGQHKVILAPDIASVPA